MLRKTTHVVVAIFVSLAPMSAFAGSTTARTVTPPAPPASVGQPGAGVHSNLTCIGQLGGRILGGHVCPKK
jgi:hypothetical protein